MLSIVIGHRTFFYCGLILWRSGLVANPRPYLFPANICFVVQSCVSGPLGFHSYGSLAFCQHTSLLEFRNFPSHPPRSKRERILYTCTWYRKWCVSCIHLIKFSHNIVKIVCWYYVHFIVFTSLGFLAKMFFINIMYAFWNYSTRLDATIKNVILI